jgi:integrase
MPRNANGEGSLYQIKSGPQKGRWAAATPPLPSGKRKVRTAATRTEAARLLTELMHDLRAGKPLDTDTQTVAQFMAHWLENVARPALKATSYARYEGTVRKHIIPGLGRVRVSKLNPQHIVGFMGELQHKGLRASTIHHIRMVLRSALQRAYEWGQIQRNPVDTVRAPRMAHSTVQPFTPEEAERLLAFAQGHRLKALITVAVTLGLRQGELLALKWADVDLDKSVLHVHATLACINGRMAITEPKTPASNRRLRLPPFLVTCLREHQDRQTWARKQAGPLWEEHGLVFPSTVGTPVAPPNLYHAFHHLLKSAGLPRHRFHDLRHTAAALMIADNVPIKLVSEILGHSNISVTLQVYGHLYDRQREEAVATLERRWGHL